ncbi:hypothetical protein [Martelella soudanensis]|uniref:hypothetical protein n=1 Tax=unclassified Martelella TaxID=2629616 RepID=UPI0015DE0AAF|nr:MULTISPECIES: hypothetical protein [unclassified Martelella]
MSHTGDTTQDSELHHDDRQICCWAVLMPNNHLSMGGFHPAFYASRTAIVLWALCLLVAVFSFGTVDRNTQALSVILCGLAAGIGAAFRVFPAPPRGGC